MPSSAAQEEKLSESIEASGGLQQFRTVSQRPKGIRDDPFGRPTPVEPATAPVKQAKSPTPPVPQKHAPPAPKAPTKPELTENENSQADRAEADLYPDKVTVPLSVALRDQSEDIARALNRSRSIRKTRITRNSVIRVALQCFLERFSPNPGHPVNSEDELLEVARSQFRK